jgi:hypothetical protein
MIKHINRDGTTFLPRDVFTGAKQNSVNEFTWEYIQRRFIQWNEITIWPTTTKSGTSTTASTSATSLTSSQAGFFTETENYSIYLNKIDPWSSSAILSGFYTSAISTNDLQFIQTDIWNLSSSISGFFIGVDYGASA